MRAMLACIHFHEVRQRNPLVQPTVVAAGEAPERGMANRDVLAVGTSAGGVEALMFLVLAQNWADRAREFEREMDVIRNSVRRMERLAAESERSPAAAAE
jgi:hypothetical protein